MFDTLSDYLKDSQDKLSWYPCITTWNRYHSLDWSENDEIWFKGLEHAILSGKARPMLQVEWRRQFDKNSMASRFNSSYELVARSYLENM